MKDDFKNLCQKKRGLGKLKSKWSFWKPHDTWSSGWNETDCMIAKDRSCLEVKKEIRKNAGELKSKEMITPV